jgi:hypothetical protein
LPGGGPVHKPASAAPSFHRAFIRSSFDRLHVLRDLLHDHEAVDEPDRPSVPVPGIAFVGIGRLAANNSDHRLRWLLRSRG